MNGNSQDESNYGFAWSQFNTSYDAPHGYKSMYEAFQYKNAHILEGSSIQGHYNTYDGSGYLYEMRGQLSYLQGNLSLLRQMNWIDKQTRAIFAEFSVYNPNINLVMVSTILIEFLSSGTIIATARFDPMNLFSETGGISFKTLCELVLLGFFLYFTYKQIKDATNREFKEYLKDFWSLIEWLIVLTGFVSFALILVRLKAAQKVLEFFKETAGFGYMKLQTANECNQVLTYSLGFCCFFGTLKILKMLRFNKNISYLGLTLKVCLSELMAFSIVFFIIWISFVQWMYLMYGNVLEGYSSFSKSMETAFQSMLGKNQIIGDFFKISPVIGPLIYAAYFLAIICFALNIFISIITDSFDEVRFDVNQDEYSYDFFDHVLKRVKKLYGKARNGKDVTLVHKYRDHFSILPKYINRLANIVFRVTFLFNSLIFFWLFKRDYRFLLN